MARLLGGREFPRGPVDEPENRLVGGAVPPRSQVAQDVPKLGREIQVEAETGHFDLKRAAIRRG